MKESLTLTIEHQAALPNGHPVSVTEAGTQMDCVVLRADVFERIKRFLPDIDPREAYPAADEVMKEDWSDPKMAEYDDYESHRP